MTEASISSKLEMLVHDDSTGAQRCYLGPREITILNVPLGSFICVVTPTKDYICSLWPSKVRNDGSMIYSKTVCRIKALDNTDSKYRLKPLHVSEGKCIHIDVVCNLSDIARFRKYENLNKKISRICSNCLYKMCVAENFVVDLRHCNLASLCGISKILITKIPSGSLVKVDAEAFIISSHTEIVVDNIRSNEKFNQVSKSTRKLIGGLDDLMQTLEDLIKLPFHHQKQFKQLGTSLPHGILLRGPPGCGKTSLVRHIANNCDAYLIAVNGPEVIGPHPGESEDNLRKLFQHAILAAEEGPCILFIDEIDVLCPKQAKSGGLEESRLTSQLLTLLDDLPADHRLIVIAATNRPSALHPSLRRPGRLDREIMINVPSMAQRREILDLHTQVLPLAEDVDLDWLAEITNGYVGADLAALCHEAAYLALGRFIVKQSERQHIHQEDFLTAFRKHRPSLQKGVEGIVDLKPVLWEQIGGLEDVKQKIKQAVEWPLRHSEAFARMGLPCPRGVLLYGPPGCSKTTLVRAAATACHATFLSLSGAQLYSPFVGSSEKMVAEVFQRARMALPSIIFLDEIDSIVGKRSEGGHRGVQERVLSTLLNEMDGVGIKLDDKMDSQHSRRILEGSIQDVEQHNSKVTTLRRNNLDILVVAATNRPELLDEALTRPGRLDRIIYVPPPDRQARLDILRLFTQKMPLEGVDLMLLSSQTEFYTGADLENLCREAALNALTRDMETTKVTYADFVKALYYNRASLTPESIEKYSRYKSSTFDVSFKIKERKVL
ncbi:hypothetical protein CHS0354_003178 [Potamilus streckersoni]|uniref:AAA+ ATPase domain-containing protein n=1 Tax=Potamilus streckersoni TaxID=2493646 RepID=A0AAE0TFX1_9BIVA|nr:hypothetical protein CHS0354_003178 [Potamilus streckersoni]